MLSDRSDLESELDVRGVRVAGYRVLRLLLIAFFVQAAQAFITSDEVGKLYQRRGLRPPVTGLTGLWSFPGVFIVVGPIIWFVQTNGALNSYWRSLGAR